MCRIELEAHVEFIMFLVNAWIFGILIGFSAELVHYLAKIFFRSLHIILGIVGIDIQQFAKFATVATGVGFVAVSVSYMNHWVLWTVSGYSVGLQILYCTVGFFLLARPIYQKLSREKEHNENSEKHSWFQICFATANASFILCLFFPDAIFSSLFTGITH